jgi:hypothetical protein
MLEFRKFSEKLTQKKSEKDENDNSKIDEDWFTMQSDITHNLVNRNKEA